MEHYDTVNRLTAHIRRGCLALMDGTSGGPQPDVVRRAAARSHRAEWWRFAMVTPTVRQDCQTLGIELGEEVEKRAGVAQLCALLKAVEERLLERLSQIPATDCRVAVQADFDAKGCRGRFLRRLPTLFRPIQEAAPDGISLYLHGSMADRTPTAFSDVDDLVILHRAAWQDPDTLTRTATLMARMSREYQNVDPLQHHGHWLITEFDLHAYRHSYMPPVVLEQAARIVGEKHVVLRLTADASGFGRNALSAADMMVERLERAARQGGLRVFDLKCLVGETAILPAYLFQMQGRMLSKSDAIRRAGELYTREAMRALEWATRVRAECAPLVRCMRHALLGFWAKWQCPRRYQAQDLYQNHSVFVANPHPLGISPRIAEALRAFAAESRALAEKGES